jgi:hypothetical protein
VSIKSCQLVLAQDATGAHYHIQIHFLELGKYTLEESDLASASDQDRWLFWLLHAHKYEPERLLELLPEMAFQQATGAEGKIELIRVLEGLLNRPAMDEAELSSKSLEELFQIAGELQRMLRGRSN